MNVEHQENCLSQFLIPFSILLSQFIHHKGRSLFIILLHNLIKFHKNLSGLSFSALLRHKSTQNDIMLSQRHSLATNKGKMEQRNKELACRRSNQGWRDLKNIYWTKNLDLMWHYQLYWDLDLNRIIFHALTLSEILKEVNFCYLSGCCGVWEVSLQICLVLQGPVQTMQEKETLSHLPLK